MRRFAASLLVFLGGFAVMVLEIIGARYLTKDFGSSFYVWISQIGVILIALALGYYLGGALADKFQRASLLAWSIIAASFATFFIPEYAPPLVDAIITRHPPDREIPPLWQKLDPVLGSTLIFFFPCFVLAMLSPYMIRLSAAQLARVGSVSGWIYGSSTVGSIAGVFVSGYVLIDQMNLSTIFRASGALMTALGVACLAWDRLFNHDPPDHATPPLP